MAHDYDDITIISTAIVKAVTEQGLTHTRDIAVAAIVALREHGLTITKKPGRVYIVPGEWKGERLPALLERWQTKLAENDAALAAAGLHPQTR